MRNHNPGANHMKLHALVLLPLLALTAPAQANTKVISYVETSGATSSDPVVSLTSGQVIKQDAGGALNHAVSGVGTNKLYAKGNGASELNGASAWMDSYTVGGTGTVNVHLSFTVDGKSAVGANVGPTGSDDNPFDWSYRVVALKGNQWDLNGQGSTQIAPGTQGWPIRSTGDNYESLLLTTQSPNDAAVTATFQPRFGVGTVWSVRDFDTDHASFASGIARVGNNVRVYSVGQPGNVALQLLYQPNQVVVTNANTGQLLAVQSYAQYPTQGMTYQRLMTQYPVLAQTGLCTLDSNTGLCPTQQTYEPTVMNLDFTLQAGDTFTLLSYLSFINLRDGEFDFYNTAKLSGITVTGQNASITSASGALQELPGGGYGYAPLAIGGVPEPANWALMIGGFGLIGGVARRRQRQAAKAASIAVGAPLNA
jgi:hypothetical protein